MRKYVKFIVGLIISFFLLYLVFRKISINEVIKYIVSANVLYLVLALIFGFFLLLLRSYRWRLIIKDYKNFKISNFFESTVLGLFFNTILPFRIGDFIQGYSLARKTNFTKSLTFSSVLMERFVDLFPPIIFIITGSFFIVLPKQISIFFSVLVLLCLILGLILILKFKELIIKTIDNFSLKLKIFKKIYNVVNNFFLAIENFKDISVLIKVGLLTFFLWFGYSFNMWLVCIALDIKLPSVFSGMLVQAITSLSVVIPSSPGYIGSWEFMGMLALSVFSVEKTKAVAFSLLSHILGMLPVVVLGLIFIFKEVKLINSLKEEIKNET